MTLDYCVHKRDQKRFYAEVFDTAQGDILWESGDFSTRYLAKCAGQEWCEQQQQELAGMWAGWEQRVRGDF